MRTLMALALGAMAMASGCGREERAQPSPTLGQGNSLDGEGVDGEAQDLSEGASNEDPAPPPMPIVEVPLDQIEVVVEALPAGYGYRFTNRSPGSIWYIGYGPGAPLYDLQGRGDEWLSLLGWCGTGATSVELRDGESIDVHPTTSNISTDIVALRVGMYFASGPDSSSDVAIYGDEWQAQTGH